MTTRWVPRAPTAPRRALLLLLACGAVLGVPWRSAGAQKRVVLYFTHSVVAGNEVTYRLPGDDATRRRGGLDFGDRLTVPSGSQVCFVVERANPLLYSYTAAAKTVAVSPPAGLEVILAGVSQFIPGSVGAIPTGATGAATARVADSLALELDGYRRYAAKLSGVEEKVGALEKLKTDSDVQDDFGIVYQQAIRRRDEALGRLKEATALHDSLAKQLLKEDDLLAQLRRYQDVLATGVTSVFRQFAEANARLLSQGLCTRVDADRLRFALSVGSLRDKNSTPVRVVKDSVAVVELEPQSDLAFSINPGVLVGPRLRRPVYGLANGVVAADTTEDPLLRPALFAEGRLWPVGWLWASIGAAKGETATPDLFFGLVARPGLSLVGTQLSVGAGLGLFQVPAGLREGASVGSALPQNVSDLEKVTDMRYRSGLAITFNLSGLKFGDGAKK